MSEIKKREAWHEDYSIFYKTYSYDDTEIMNNCFEKDWSQVSIKKLQQSSPAWLKSTSRKIYPLIYEIYRHLAGIGARNGDTSIP